MLSLTPRSEHNEGNFFLFILLANMYLSEKAKNILSFFKLSNIFLVIVLHKVLVILGC